MTAVPTGSGAVGRNEKQTGGERFKKPGDNENQNSIDTIDYTQGDSDVIPFHIYAGWFLPPPCG